MKTDTTRRAVLGAIAAVPVVVAVATPALANMTVSDGGRFARRLATYRRLRAKQDVFYDANVTPRNDEHNRRFGDPPGLGAHPSRETPQFRASIAHIAEAEREFGRRVDRTMRAMELLFHTPARDTAALASKLEIALAEEAYDHNEIADYVAAFLADARRLSAGA